MLEHIRGNRGLDTCRPERSHPGARLGSGRQPSEGGPFSFSVDYSLSARQVGRLIVTGPRVTSEGFPPVTNLIPLVLDA